VDPRNHRRPEMRVSHPSDEKYDWTFTFHGDGAFYYAVAHTYAEAMEKVREMKPGNLIPKMVRQEKASSGRIIYLHPKEPQVDTDEENYLTSGWSGRDGGRDDS